MRAGAMGVDVQRTLGAVHLLIGLTDRARAALAVGCRCGDVEGVAGVAVAGQFGVDVRAALKRVLVLLKHHDARALAHDEAAAALVEGQGCRIGIRGLGQRLTVGEAAHRQRIDGGLAAARDDRVGIAVMDRAIGLADGVGGSGAGRHHRKARALAAKANGDVARSDVGNHHRHEQRRNAGGTALEELVALREDRADAADAAAHIHAQALGIHLALDAAVGNCLNGRRHGVLGEEIHAPRVAAGDSVLLGIKFLDLCCHGNLGVGRIKARNLADTAPAVFQALEDRLNITADGRDRAHAGNDNSVHSTS